MKRDLRLFYIYRLLSSAYLFVPAQVAFLRERGLSFTEIMVITSVFSSVVLVFEVPTGALADRIGRRFAMMLGSAAMALAFFVYYLSSSFALFVLAEGIFALGMTLSNGSDSAYLYDLVQSEGQAFRYTAYEGTASSFKQIGMTVAFLAGGFIGKPQIALPYLATAGVCLTAGLVAAFMREPAHARHFEKQTWSGYVPHMSNALRTALAGKRLRWAILYSALVFILLRMSFWVYQPYLADVGLDLGAIGLVLAAVYLMAAICSHHVQRIRARFKNGSIYWVLPAVLGVTFLLLGRFVALGGIALMFAQKAVDGVYSPLTKEMLNREISSSPHRATVLSVESMVRRIAFAAFAPACGLLWDHYGRSAALYLCAVVGGLGAYALMMRGRAAHLEAGLTAEPVHGRVTRS